VAMRNNIVELMAEPLTPLFGTLGLSSINKSLGDLLTKFFGKPGIMPGDLIISVNEYAYYNGSIKPWPMVKIILGSVGILKRMFAGAVERWTEIGRPQYGATVEGWQTKQWRQLPATEILKAACELSEAAIDAYGALVSGVIPAAWMSEGLFTLVYKLIKRGNDATAPTYLMGFDSLPIRAEKSLYDLAEWARQFPALIAYLTETPSSHLASQLGERRPPPGIEAETWAGWQGRFQMYLQEFGHMIYNLDFANPVPADDPVPLLDTIKVFLQGQGANPHTRQQTAAERREQATQAMLNRLKGLRLRSFSSSLARAQRYAPLREDGLADVGLSYPLLRQMLLEIGRRFAESGMINDPDDVFWLNQDEVERAAARLERKEPLDDLSERVLQRKATWRAAKHLTPPVMLPQIKLLGIDISQMKAGRAQRRAKDSLKGVAASPGSVTAPARVLHGPEDFAQMKSGDVLVAPITTPAWTPLFARAAAIVTDVGGPLSHGSIVAREYGIPAVLGTGTATKRIRNGQLITVDGSAGKVILSAS
jgi:phosphohistidine swiveling domain-containing protein